MTEQDMQEVMDRLTESPDDIVFGPLDPLALETCLSIRRDRHTREWFGNTRTDTIQLITNNSIKHGKPWGVLKPFTDSDGHRWYPGDENER